MFEYIQIEIKASWLQCVVFALIISLAVFCVYLIATIKYAPGFTQNKLTLRPYTILLIYTGVFLIQSVIATVFETMTLWVLIPINVLKMSLQSSAVSVQVFEWFAIYRMIIFQKQYDMTTVGVELRKFKPQELRDRRVYKCVLYTIVGASFALAFARLVW